MSGEAVYGMPPRELAVVSGEARQLSPLHTDSASLEATEPKSLARITVMAPAGAVERRYALALALRSLADDGELVAIGRKDRGGLRLRGELQAFGCVVEEEARRHHRFCRCRAPAAAAAALDSAVEAGGPQFIDDLGLWSQPGVFSWDRLDPGTALLSANLPPLAGRGADLGCGVGVLGLHALRSAGVRHLLFIDIDVRAIAASRRNVADERAGFLRADVRRPAAEWADTDVGRLDFILANPPFHCSGDEDRDLGEAFLEAAAQLLAPDGRLLMVANAALPYERTLTRRYRQHRQIARARGFKVLEARR
ncbi:MAG: methyltransferase [Caulobacteraceae bacterium]